MGKIIMNGNAYGSIGSDVEANPQGTATDTLNTIGIDNVIYEIQGGGGGGGNVDDVYVNGASVLDSSHIAQITSYKEVTKAQYDAIPNKDNDNILYCITDEGEVIGDNFNPIIYSLSEREIGTWTDGKPLYQKTFVGTTDNQQYFIPNTSYIETLVSVNGYMSEPGWDYELPFNDGSDFISITNNETNGAKLYTSSYFVGFPFVATLQYTKKTDVPGGGQYTSLGIPAVHYSTDEQVVGTWIDGSTIYQKTISLNSSLSINANSWGTVDTLSEFIKIIECNGLNEDNGEFATYPLGSNCDSNNIFTVLNVRNTAINIKYITIKYLKPSV